MSEQELALIKKIVLRGKEIVFRGGEKLFSTGEIPSDIYFVFSGQICLIDPIGKTYEAEEGEFLGLREMISNCFFSKTAVVLQSAKVILISRPYFREILQKNGMIRNYCLFTLCRQIEGVEFYYE